MKPTRRWLQFSLRGLIVMLTIGCLWLGWKVNRAHRRGRAIDAVIEAGGEVIYLGATQERIQSQDEHFKRDLAGRPVAVYFHKPLDSTLGRHLSDISGIVNLQVSVESDNDLRYLEGLNDVHSVVCHIEENVTREGLTKLQKKLPNTEIATVDWRAPKFKVFRP